MHKHLFATLIVAALLAGCSKSGGKAEEATLPELNRALSVWVLSKGEFPKDIGSLTNHPAIHGKTLPTPPPGKKLAIDVKAREIVFVDQ